MTQWILHSLSLCQDFTVSPPFDSNEDFMHFLVQKQPIASPLSLEEHISDSTFDDNILIALYMVIHTLVLPTLCLTSFFMHIFHPNMVFLFPLGNNICF